MTRILRLKRAPTPDRRSRRGQSLVELTIAAPVLMMILLGTIDLGRVFFDYIQLRSGAIDGAVYGIRNPGDTTGVEDEVQNSGVPAGTTVSVTTTGDCVNRGGNGTLTVEATSTFSPLTTEFFARFGLDAMTLRADSTMRCMT